MTTIYHGTPMTPRAALMDVCAGRALCISFYRPDDVEAAEAISPAIMFRQRRVFILETGAESRKGMGRGSELVGLFRLAGASFVPTGAMGCHPRYAGGTIPAQRRTSERMAIRTKGRSTLAHGRADQPTSEVVREIRPGLPRLDRSGQVNRLPCLSRTNARSGSGIRESLAGHAHDARDAGCLLVSVPKRGQHFARTERVAL